jgi:hypothetical protein
MSDPLSDNELLFACDSIIDTADTATLEIYERERAKLVDLLAEKAEVSRKQSVYEPSLERLEKVIIESTSHTWPTTLDQFRYGNTICRDAKGQREPILAKHWALEKKRMAVVRKVNALTYRLTGLREKMEAEA